MYRDKHSQLGFPRWCAAIRRSGPVFLGKTNLAEFCYGATTQNDHYGNCLNPWDTTRVTGGSSGGRRRGECRRHVPHCVRLRHRRLGAQPRLVVRGRRSASHHRLGAQHQRAGAQHPRPTLSACWPTTSPTWRGASSAIAGYDPADSFSEDVPVDNFLPTLRDGIAGVRVGIPRTFYYENCEPDVVARVQTAAAVIRGVRRHAVSISTCTVPRRPASRTGPVLLSVDMADLYRDGLKNHPEKFGAEVLRRLRAGEPFSGMDYAHALARADPVETTNSRWYSRSVDMLLVPTTPVVAPKITNAEDLQRTTHNISRNNVALGYAGLPCLSVPVGFDGQHMPVGMQLVGKWFNEPLLFRAGVRLSGAHRVPQDAAKLAA